MKIQHLAIIFLLIILPIDIVLSLYIDAQINTLRLQSIYDSKLVTCAYDALEVFQSNAIADTENDIVNAKMDNIEASASTFLTSLQTSFGYSGYKATVMQEYVPAVVYTMYDGYYIYSKFNNTLSETYVRSDSSYNEGTTIEGLKSYVYYSCRYQRNRTSDKYDDFVITYTLDNYITIQGIIDGVYVNDSGYLIDGITKINGTDEYEYDGISFSETSTETLKELVGDKFYNYVKINGIKYYHDDGGTPEDKSDDRIFHIVNGTKNYSQAKFGTDEFDKYYKAIYENKSAYLYYKEAYEFTNLVRSDRKYNKKTDSEGNIQYEWIGYGLSDLSSKDAVYWDSEANNGSGGKGNFVSIPDFGNYNIFEASTEKYIQDSDSDFNQHRAAVIRYTIETNLTAAIAGFSEYSDQLEFAMPKISETNWDIIENNVCIIGFLQGLDIGTKKYNGYAVVANTTTEEYVDEDAIYIVTDDNQYHRANEKDLLVYTIGNSDGVFKSDFERHYIKETDSSTGNQTTIYYYPKSPNKTEIYSASYSSVINQTAVDTTYSDMYKYMRNLDNDTAKNIKTAYYTALARERYSSYKVSHDKANNYFLNNY